MKRALFMLGYLLAAAVGWFASIWLSSDSSAQLDESRPAAKAAEKEQTGEEILASYMTKKTEVSKQAAPIKAKPVEVIDYLEKFRAELEPSDDPRRTFFDLIESDGEALFELWASDRYSRYEEDICLVAIRLEHWFNEDPAACMEELRQLDQPFVTELLKSFQWGMAQRLYAEKGLRESVSWLESMAKGELHFNFSIHLEDIAQRASIDDFLWLRESHPSLVNGFAPSVLANNWPKEELDELLSVAEPNQFVMFVLHGINRMGEEKATEWFLDLASNPDFAEHFATSRGQAMASQFVKFAQSEEELAQVMAVFDLEQSRLRPFTNRLITSELSELLEHPNGDQDDDLLYRFRNGKITATEIRDQLFAESPRLMLDEKESLVQLYRALAEEDQEAAFALLGTPTKAEEDSYRGNAARWAFFKVDPDQFYQMVEPVDLSGDPKMVNEVRIGWENKTQSNLQLYGEEYLDWVVALPPGQHRDWALQSVVKVGRENYPDLAQQATNLLKDQ